MENLENAGSRSASKPSTFTLRLPVSWVPLIIFAVFLLAWEGAVQAEMLSAMFFPPPSVILRTFSRQLADGTLGVNLAATLTRLFVGFVIGAVPALLLGLLMGWSRRFNALVNPFIAAIHPVPKTALLPLIIILFGIGERSRIVSIAFAAFFPILINAAAGVRQISPVHFEVAENYGASRRKIFTRVLIPGSLPSVLTGLHVGFNLALTLTIVIEMLGASDGLGEQIWSSWQTLRIEELYVALFITALLGVLFNVLLNRLTRWIAPWRTEREVI